MDRYIGLDAHSQSCTFAVMGASGRRLTERVLETNGTLLVEFIKSIAGKRHLCLEEGTQSEWLYELLKPHVDEIIVVQPRKHELAARKSDSLDAWGLAERIRTGSTAGAVFKAPGLYSELRAAVRAHQLFVSDMVRAKNRLKAVFRSRGLRDIGTEIYAPETRAKWIQKLPVHRRKLATLLGSELDAVTKLHDKATAWLQEQASRCSILKLIATAPGIGPIRAAQIVATVLCPQRFRTRQQFWSYCGLGLVTHSSSDWSRDKRGNLRRETPQIRGLNYNRNPMLKAVFKGAAMQIERMPAHPLHADYERMTAAGRKPSVARVTIARRIAASVLAMWKNKEEYDPAKRQPKPHAA